MKKGTLKQLKEIDGDDYFLAQVDIEIESILESIGYKGDGFSFLVVKYDDSGADLEEVWGGNSPSSHAFYELLN